MQRGGQRYVWPSVMLIRVPFITLGNEVGWKYMRW